jgi:hypothetical protein
MAPTRRLGGTQMSDATIAKVAVGVVVTFLVVGGALFAGSLVGNDPTASVAPEKRPVTPTTLPTRAVTTSSAPSSRPSPARKKGRTESGMRSFVARYLSTVTDEPAAGWQMLTPKFRGESGGFGSYQAFWSEVTVATPSGVYADPESGTVSYAVAYTHRDGSHSDDRTRLTLRFANGRYLIDAEG